MVLNPCLPRKGIFSRSVRLQNRPDWRSRRNSGGQWATPACGSALPYTGYSGACSPDQIHSRVHLCCPNLGAAALTGVSAAGGTARLIVLDNLREGVLSPDIYDPSLNPLYRDVLYAVVMPCRIQDPDPADTARGTTCQFATRFFPARDLRLGDSGRSGRAGVGSSSAPVGLATLDLLALRSRQLRLFDWQLLHV